MNKDYSQAGAHWGIVLCKYGIEYVVDPATGKRIPTCHRASYEAIRSDADYQAAIDYADGEQQSIGGGIVSIHSGLQGCCTTRAAVPRKSGGLPQECCL